MTISEYELHGVSGRRPPFEQAARTRLRAMKDDDERFDTLTRLTRIEWALVEYQREGKTEQLEIAAAWLLDEWES